MAGISPATAVASLGAAGLLIVVFLPYAGAEGAAAALGMRRMGLNSQTSPRCWLREHGLSSADAGGAWVRMLRAALVDTFGMWLLAEHWGCAY